MLLQENLPKVTKSGTFKEQAFTLKAGSKIFRLLSDSLYSNKVKAVIRELSTNAYDAHIAANNPNPFDVHLPSNMEPWFSIRDYGTGLSEKDIFEIYTKYGESTKDNSDDFVGCLGLGSKSPFCIPGNDSFSVTSYFNGVKYDYTAYINEEGIPQIALIDSEKTTQSNGLEVRFGVDKALTSQFHYEAPKVYKWFPVKPKITGYNITIVDIVHGDISGQIQLPSGKLVKWSVIKNETSHVLMGNVPYPLSYNWTKSEHQRLMSYGINLLLEVPIGFCNFTVSREALEYNDVTVKNLELVLDEVYSTMSMQIQTKIDKAKTYWEACQIYVQEKSLCDYFLPKPEWQKRKLVTYLNVKVTDEIKHVYSYGQPRSYEKQEIHFDFDDAYVIQDKSVAPVKRCKQLINDSPKIRSVWLINQTLADELKQTYDAPDNLFYIQANLPYDKVSKVSSVRKEKVMRFDAGYNGTTSWKDATVTANDKIYYVELNRYKVLNSGTQVEWRTLDNIVKVAKEIGFKGEIYGVKTSIIQKAKKNPNWIDFFEHTKPLFENYVQSNEEKLAVHLNWRRPDWVLPKLKVKHTKYNYLQKEYERLKKIAEQKFAIGPWLDAFSFYGINKPGLKFQEEVEALEDKYPILDELRDWKSSYKIQENIVQYLELLEKEGL